LSPGLIIFLDTLKRIYVSIPFFEALKKAFPYLVLRELFFKKSKLEKVLVAPIGEVYSAVLQSK